MTALLVAGAIVACVAIVCAVRPVTIFFKAPDGADLAILEIRHPAFSFDAWLPPSTALAWALGERPLPPMLGQVMGIPFDRSTVIRAMRAMTARSQRRRAKPDAPLEPERIVRVPRELDSLASILPERWQAPAHLLRAVWPRTRGALHRAINVEVFAIRARVGTGDPALTGMLSGVAWQIAAMVREPWALVIDADFTRLAFSATGEARVAIVPWRAFVAVVTLGFASWREWRLLAPGTMLAAPEGSHGG